MILSSLRNRIFLTSALLAVLSIGSAIYLVSVRVTREREESMQREIRSTGVLVEQLRTTRAQTFSIMARLVADAPTLKAALSTDVYADQEAGADAAINAIVAANLGHGATPRVAQLGHQQAQP